MLGANGVVAAGIPIATGAAHALKLRGTDALVACFFGDGAANRGPFLEGLNWAKVYRLPVLFVCEDNRISATTDTVPMTGGEGVSARATALGIRSVVVEGSDVEAVYAAAGALVERVRAGEGPVLLHAITNRFKGHVSVDTQAYRDPKVLQDALAFDPLTVARRALGAKGCGTNELDAVDAQATAEIAEALAQADAAPWPAADEAYTDIITTGAGQWH
jgi:acetoin:2,6-dichlorophenolindophenol oxidoreductase subunit alpha